MPSLIHPSRGAARRLVSAVALVMPLLCLSLRLAHAANVSWISATSGNWSDGSKWSGGTAPTAADTALVTLPGTYTVTVDVNPSVAALTAGAATGVQTLSLGTHTLTLANASSLTGGARLEMNTAAIAGAGSLTTSATIVARGPGNTIANDLFAPTGSLIKIEPSNGGFAEGRLTVANGFTNFGTIELTDSYSGYATGARIVVTAGTLVNAFGATIKSTYGIQPSGVRTIDAQLDNHGTLDVQVAMAINHAGAAHTNSGAIALSTAYGDLTVTQSGASPSFTHTGTIAIGAGRTFVVNGGAFAFDPGTTSGAGDLIFRNCAITGLTLTATSARAILDGGNTVDNCSLAGTLIARYQPNTITGSLTNVAGSLLRVEPGNQAFVEGQLTLANAFTNFGTVELTDSFAGYATGSRLKVNTGSLINAAGATIKSTYGIQPSGMRTIDAQLDNRGTLDVQVATTINHASAAHANSGAISLSTAYGDLTLTQTGTTPSFTHTGTIAIGAGRSFVVNGGAFAFNPGLSSGAGDLIFRNCAITGLTLTATSARTILDGGNTVDNCSLAGTLVARYQPNTITGSLTNAAGSLLRVEPGNQAFVEGQLTLANAFTNFGTVELTDSFAGYATGSRLKVNTGSLINAAGATIKSTYGIQPSGVRTIDAQLDNRGTLDVQVAMTINHASAAHANSGAITLSTAYGDLTVTQTGTAPSFTHTGTIAIGAGRTFVVNGGAFAFDPGTTNGPGDLIFRNCAITGLTLTATSARTILDGGNTVDNCSLAGTLVARYQPNTITGSLTNVAGSLLRIEPGNQAFVEGQLTLANAFTNFGTVELTDSFAGYATGSRLKVNTGSLINAAGATIKSTYGIQPSGMRTIDAQLDNRGTLDVQVAMTINHASAAHANSGAITLSTAYGDLTLTQTGTTPSFTHTGTIAIGAGRTFVVTGGAFAFDPGTTSGPGDLIFRNCAITGLTLTATSARTILDGGNTVDNCSLAGTLIARYQPNTITGSLTNVAGSLLRVEPGTQAFVEGQLTLANAFTNFGTVELTDSFAGYATGSRLKVNTGSLINAAGATIKSTYGVQPSGMRTIDAQLDNRGTLDVQVATTINHASAAHANSGAISLSTAYGDLTLTQTGTTPAFTHTGTISVGAGRTFLITGGAFAFNPGTTSGAGDLLFRNCAITGLTLASTSARVILDGSTTVDTASVAGSLVARTAPNTIAVMSTSPSGLVRVEPGAQSFTEGQLTVNTGFTNYGTLELTDSYSGYATGSRLRVVAGTLVNAAGATIKSTSGLQPAGIRRLTATVVNHGSLRADGATLLPELGPVLNDVDGTIGGAGTLDVSSVTFTNLGTVSPGTSPGIFTVTPNLATAASGRHIIEIGGRSVGSQYDRLAITNTATLGGTLDLRLVNGFVPVLGDSFVIVTASTVSGQYAAIAGRTLPNGLEWNVKYRPGRVDLIAGTPLPNTWPAAVNDTVVIDEDAPYVNIPVLANDVDPDGDTLHVVWNGFTVPQHGFASLQAGELVQYVASPNYSGGDSFTYTVTDSRGGTSIATVFVTIRPINDAPVFTLNTPGDGAVYHVAAGYPMGFPVEAVDQYDPAGVVTLTSTTLPAGATLTPSLPVSGHQVTTQFVWTPGPLDGGTHVITFTATDDSLAAVTRTITIEVDASTAVAGPRLQATWTGAGVDLAWRLAAHAAITQIVVERTASLDAAWESLADTRATFSTADGAYHVTDRTAHAGSAYWYRLAFTLDGVRTVSEPVRVEAVAAVAFALAPPSPNPAAGACRIDFALPQDGLVRLSVLDVQGREVARLADGTLQAGHHSMTWDGRLAGRPAASGVYVVRLTTGGASLTRRLIVGH